MKKYLYIVILLLYTPLIIAQNKNDDARLEYQKLKNSEVQIVHNMDSLDKLLNIQRNKYALKAAVSTANIIIDTENKLYQLKTKLDELKREVYIFKLDNNIENKSNTVSLPTNSYKNLLDNSFFVENISTSDRDIISTTPCLNKRLISIEEQIETLYLKLKNLKESFSQATSQEQVNSIIKASINIKQNIKELDYLTLKLWTPLYNKKIDNYLVLLDKIGAISRNELEKIDQLSRNVIQAETIFESLTMTPNLSVIMVKKRLVLGYEELLSIRLNLKLSRDSIKLEINNLRIVDNLSDIIFSYRNILIYSDITIGNNHSYSDLSSVPLLKFPTKGLYYCVQVAFVMGEVSALKIFKGAEPLQKELLGLKKRYVIGRYRTYEDVTKAVHESRHRFKFKVPKAIAWIDGEQVSLGQAQDYEVSHNIERFNSSGYKVELVSGNISAELKSLIDIHASDKTIVRYEQGDKFLFIISQFNTPGEADMIAYILEREIDSSLSINVLNL